MPETHSDRRDFIRNTSAAVIAAGAYSVGARAYAKNDMVSIGVIGTGGRGRNTLMKALKSIPGVELNAVCDVYDNHLKSAHATAGGREREVMQTVDYGEILARDDIDAVVIATPDHLHTPIVIDACEAGKDVYVEKPLTHNIEEGKRVIDVTRRTGRVVQVGAQQRTMPHLVELRRRIVSGQLDLGPVHRIHMQWNRNHTPYHKPNYKIAPSQVDWKRFLGDAPDQPFDPLRMRQWRCMWDFGNGPLSDLMVHWLDASDWLFDLPMPARIVSLGDNYTTKGVRETPDTMKTVFEYPDRQLLVDFEATWANDHEHGSMRIMSEKATVYIDRARFEIVPQKDTGSKAETMVVSQGPRGMGDYSDYDAAGLHLADWLEAVREGREPADPVEAGVQASNVCHYGNIAYRERRLVEIG